MQSGGGRDPDQDNECALGTEFQAHEPRKAWRATSRGRAWLPNRECFTEEQHRGGLGSERGCQPLVLGVCLRARLPPSELGVSLPLE